MIRIRGIIAASLIMLSGAQARDTGQWDKEDPAIRQWYSTLMRPDAPMYSCCGEADAYWADVAEVGPNGETIAVITDEREDAPLQRSHEKLGNRYVVPQNKIKFDKGNPTGHIVIFLTGPSWNSTDPNVPAHRDVLCYVLNGGV